MKYINYIIISLICLLLSCGLRQEEKKDYIYNGFGYYDNKEYDKSIAEFDKVLEQDPNNSEALYGKAKANLKKAYIDLFYVADIIVKWIDKKGTINLLSQLTNETVNGYDILKSVSLDLKKIADNKATGNITKDDVILDYATINVIRFICSLLDLNNDGKIQYEFEKYRGKFPIELIVIPTEPIKYSLKIGEELINNFNSNTVNKIIQNGCNTLEESAIAFEYAFRNSKSKEANKTVQETKDFASKTKEDIVIYYSGDKKDNDGDWQDTNHNGQKDPTQWNIPIHGASINGDKNTRKIYIEKDESGWYKYGREFSSGDWGVDEEVVDGIDNDSDGKIDEDTAWFGKKEN